MSQHSVVPRKRKAPLPKITKVAIQEHESSAPRASIQRHVHYRSVDGRVSTQTTLQKIEDALPVESASLVFDSTLLPDSTSDGFPEEDTLVANFDDDLEAQFVKDLVELGETVPRRARSGPGVSALFITTYIALI